MSTFADTMSIGSEIRRVRKEKGLNQSQLADLCDLKQQELSNYESDKITPTGPRLQKIADALGKKWKLK